MHVLNMITGINESKTLTEHISCKCELSLILKNVIPIKNGIAIRVSVSVKILKNFVCAKKTCTFGILQHVVAKMVNM